MRQGYRRTKTTVSLLNFHFVWCPKRRQKVLAGPVERDLRKLLLLKAADLDCKILALEIMPDHVHLFLNCPPTLSPSDAMFWLKGSTSDLAREISASPTHDFALDSLLFCLHRWPRLFGNHPTLHCPA